MKKHNLTMTAYLSNHLGWLKGAMLFLDGDDDKNNELGKYELEHALWLLKKFQGLNLEAVGELVKAIEAELEQIDPAQSK
jgi:hypothetical protein